LAAAIQLGFAMNWFYAINGQQTGPVSDAQLDELLRSGKITQDTSVWREGMADWQVLRTARTAAPPPIIAAQSDLACAECGRNFPAGDVVKLMNSWVCAGCKPIFLQRIREGATPSGASGGLWRMDKQLVTRSETPFPDRCVRCNAPAHGYRLKRQFYWHPPAYFLFVLLNILIYAIVAMCVRKRAVLHIGLCDHHRSRRKWGIAASWVGLFGGVGVIIFGASAGVGLVTLLGIVLVLGGIIWGNVAGVRVSPAKITKENVWLKGVNQDFLAELPEWTGS
jgi:hypothetical protein